MLTIKNHYRNEIEELLLPIRNHVPDPDKEIPRLDRFLAIRKKYLFRRPHDMLLRPEQFTTASEWIARFKKLDLWDCSDYQVENFYRSVFLKSMERKERRTEKKKKGYERLKGIIQDKKRQVAASSSVCEKNNVELKAYLRLKNQIDICTGRTYDYEGSHHIGVV